MKKPLLAALLACIPALLTAQEAPPLQWAHSFGNTYWDGVWGVTTDAEDNLYVGGNFGLTVDFDPADGVAELNGASQSALVAKYNTAGGLVWAKAFVTSTFTSEVRDIVRDTQGNVITTGLFGGTCDFDPGAGVFNISTMTNPYSAMDIFISKLDANGNYIWAKAIQAIPTTEKGVSSVATDDSGNIYITGVFEETVDFNPGAGVFNITAVGEYDSYIVKLDANGSFLWAKNLGGSASDARISNIVINGDTIYLGGNFTGTVDFDPGTGTQNATSQGSFTSDVFLAMYTTDGDFEWVKTIGNTFESRLYDLAKDSQGNILATGYINGVLDVDPGAGVHNFGDTASGTAAYVLKFSPIGNFIWAGGMAPGSNGNGLSLSVSDDDAVYATGTFYQNSSFFAEPSGVMASFGERDLYLVKLSKDGVPLWQKQMGGTDHEDYLLTAPTANGSVYVAGNFKETLHFVPGTPEDDLAALGVNDLFVARFAFPETANTLAQAKEKVLVYPNPSAGALYIDVPESLMGATASVYTVLGQRVAQFNITQKTTQQQFAPGFYILEVANGAEKQAVTFVVNQ